LEQNGLPKTSFNGSLDIPITLIATDAHSGEAYMRVNGLAGMTSTIGRQQRNPYSIDMGTDLNPARAEGYMRQVNMNG